MVDRTVPDENARRRTRVRIEKVDRGPVEASIAANGTVTRELEEVIASPVDARVTRILKRAGDAVKAGQPILKLDLFTPFFSTKADGRGIGLTLVRGA